MTGGWDRALGIASLCLILARPALAHVGPPFPIVENQRTGPYMVSVWAHPDLGTGAFYVFLDPAPGKSLPSENQVQVTVQPLSGRLPEATYLGIRQDVRDRVEYYAEAEFDQQELWRVRVQISSAAGDGEVDSQVEPTPTSYGRWDLLIYAFPFVLFGGLWLSVILRRRRCSVRDPASPSALGPAPSGP